MPWHKGPAGMSDGSCDGDLLGPNCKARACSSAGSVPPLPGEVQLLGGSPCSRSPSTPCLLPQHSRQPPSMLPHGTQPAQSCVHQAPLQPGPPAIVPRHGTNMWVQENTISQGPGTTMDPATLPHG